MMIKKILFLFFLLIIIFIPSYIVSAGCCNSGGPTAALDEDCTPCIPNPLTGGYEKPDVNTIIGTAINAVLGLVGSIALVMFIYGGFVWMTAMGNKESVTKGKDIIIWSVAGLAVIFLAYAVVNFVLGSVIGGMGTG